MEEGTKLLVELLWNLSLSVAALITWWIGYKGRVEHKENVDRIGELTEVISHLMDRQNMDFHDVRKEIEITKIRKKFER